MNYFKRYKNSILSAAVFLVSLALTACQQLALNAQEEGLKQNLVPPVISAAGSAKPLYHETQTAQEVTKAIRAARGNAPVDVEVKEGVVALIGEAPNLVDRMRIIEAAQSVQGVKAVVPFIDLSPVNRSNSVIEKDISTALEANPETRGQNIVVMVNQGMVTLESPVGSEPVKNLATWIAANVPGVTEVDNVMVAPDEMVTPVDIKNAIANRFASDRSVAKDVTVAVNDGRVILNGRMKSPSDKINAIAAAYSVGVRSVEGSGLEVNADLASPSGDEIQRAVETAYAHIPSLVSSKLKAGVKNGVVVLTGEVSDLKTRDIAGLLAAQFPGVKEVRNNLSVRVDPLRSDQKLTEILCDAYLSSPRVNVYQLHVGVSHGRVLLEGVVNTMHQKWSAEDIAERTLGVVAVDNQIKVTNTPEPEIVSYPMFHSWEFTDLWWTVPKSDLKMDSELTAEIKDQLYWSPFTDARTIVAGVKSDVVTLAGTVKSEVEKKAAEDAAYQAGAVAVEDHLVVAGKSPAVATN